MSGALGVPVEPNDDGSEPGQFDFRFTLSDGRSGAAEMTTITDPSDRQWLGYRSYSPRIEDSKWAWHIRRRGHNVRWKDLMRHLQVLAPIAEKFDEPDLAALARRSDLMGNESASWLRAARIDIDGLRGHSKPGRVFVSGDSIGGFIGDEPSLDPMLDWLEATLAAERFNGDFSKINTSGCDEQHLVLRIDVGDAIPAEHALALIDPNTSVPTRPPKIRGRHLTGLWLMQEWGGFFTYWTASEGWSRIDIDVAARPPHG